MIAHPTYAGALAAAELVFAEGEADGHRMAIAVYDEAAELFFAARMDITHQRVLHHACRKAFTAALMQRDTVVFGRQDRERDKTLAEWGDSRLTYLPGGVALLRGDDFLGGVGVGGNDAERDHEIAAAAARLLVGMA